MKWIDRNMALVGGLVLIWLAGCGPNDRLESASATPPQKIETPTSLGMLAASATGQSASPTPSPLPLRTATVTSDSPPTAAVAMQPCSPLKDLTLAELPEIIADGYHPPPMGKDGRHQGIDFSYYRRGDQISIQGEVIQSVYPGRVAAAVRDSFPFGNMIMIETSGAGLPAELRQRSGIQAGESIYILYAHMLATPELRLGESVQACQELGQVGKTGNAGVAHLHLETRRGPANAQFPVMAYYLAENSPEERANYLLWETSGVFQHFNPLDLLNPSK